MLIKLKKQASWRIQINVLVALLRREMSTRFGKYKLGLLWLVIEPLVAVIVLGLILSPFMGKSSDSDTPFAFFMLCGVMILKCVTGPVNASLGAIGANKGLLVFRQLKPIDPFLARFIFEYISSLLSFTLFCLIGLLFDIKLSGDNLLLVLASFTIAWLMGCGLGLLFGINCLKFNELEKVNSFIQRPLFFCSCLFYSIESMPYKIQQVLLLNPIVHTVEVTRIGLFENYSPSQVNLTYPLLFAIVVLALGVVSYRNNTHYLTQR